MGYDIIRPIPWDPPYKPPYEPPIKGKEASPCGQYIPLTYGRCKVQGIFVYLKQIDDIVDQWQRFIHGIWVFNEGEIGEYEQLLINGKDISTYYNVTAEYYTGTDTQPVCGLSAYDATFNDPIQGYAYVYLRFGSGSGLTDMPTVEVVGKWRKVYDPRISATIYSSNPALCLADLHTHPHYGNSPIDWESVRSCADYCDELLGAEMGMAQKRYDFNYCFKDGTIADAMNIIKTHFLGSIYPNGSTYSMHVMRPKYPAASFTEFDDNGKKEIWDVTLPGFESQDTVSRVTFSYTDPETWEEITAPHLDDPLIATNQAEIHEVVYDLTGCLLYAQAYRIALAILNMRLSDLFIKFSTYNSKGLQPWDVFTVTHGLGLNDKQFFCLAVSANDDGSYLIEGREYDPVFFSDEIETEPTFPDTDLPDPTDTPPNVESLSLIEELTQLKGGAWVSVIRASWVPRQWDFTKHYEVWYKVDDGDYTLINITTGNTYELRIIEELATYTFKIVTVSFWDIKSSGVESTIIPQGKYLPPTWKEGAALTAVEAGDIVFLKWYMPDYTPPAYDIDTLGYEVRRGAVTDTWETAFLITYIDALSYIDKNCPGGTWRYFLKAKDSVENYTDEAIVADVLVTLNPYSTFQHDRFFNLSTITGSNIGLCLGNIITPIHPSYDTIGERFPGSTLGDGVGGAYTYLNLPAPALAECTTSAVDIGQVISGTWDLNYLAQKLGTGTALIAPKLLISSNGVDYVEYDASGVLSAIGRYVKAKFIFNSSSLDTTHILFGPAYVTIICEPKSEFGEVTVPTSGPDIGVAHIVFTTGFLEIDKVILTPLGNQPRIACADNLTASGFDLCLFSTSGNPAGGDVKWLVEGF